MPLSAEIPAPVRKTMGPSAAAIAARSFSGSRIGPMAVIRCELAELARAPLLQVDQLDLEQQRGVRRNDAAGPAGAIAEGRRDDQRALAADLHAGDAFVPPLDHLALPEREGKRAPAIVRAIELGALGAVRPEPAGVVHHAGPAGGLGAGAGKGVLVLESARGGRHGHARSYSPSRGVRHGRAGHT